MTKKAAAGYNEALLTTRAPSRLVVRGIHHSSCRNHHPTTRRTTKYCKSSVMMMLLQISSLLSLMISSSSGSRATMSFQSVAAFQPSTTHRIRKHRNDQQEGPSSSSQQYVLPLQTDDETKNDSPSSAFPTPVLLDWNASGSIGALLMQMQKKEEEMRKLNKTLLDKDQAIDLSLHNATISKSLLSLEGDEEDDDEVEAAVDVIDAATAKELDEAITPRISSSPGKEVQILELPELYRVLQERPKENITTAQDGDTAASTDVEEEKVPWPSLSKPEHYEERIGRDMRQLAVSIASCIDNVNEFQTYNRQIRGGIFPLVECIREGAKAVRRQKGDDKNRRRKPYFSYVTPDVVVSSQHEERFLAASSACRALRDLCGISLDLAVVITDGLLRANANVDDEEKEGDSCSLMEDLVTLLQYANDADITVTSKARRRGLLLLRRSPEPSQWKLTFSQNRREARLQCKLYVLQLLLTMACSSDSAVDALRSTPGLRDAVQRCSSYARVERTRRWLRYPGEAVKSFWQKARGNKERNTSSTRRRPFIEATSVKNDLNGKVQGTANQILAAMGYNQWIPKIPGQKGLRILCLDGGGSRGMTSVIAVDSMVKALGGVEVADCFDMVVGTSTGAIIAFLIGLKLETSEQAVDRYDVLIPNIFTKSALSTPLLLFTTATYDESPFMNILSDILEDYTMLDSRADPAVPYVFAVTSKMSSTPTHVALFRNYNYNGGELPDPFVIKPEDARETLGLSLENEDERIRSKDYPKRPSQSGGAPWRRQQDGSRHPGSFRVLQRYALRASTAAPTVFKPVLMGGEMYCDGGIVASNPTAIGIHEARTLFPDVPIELVVSIGTGGFLEQKSAPRIGWDGIIGQIVDSACDGEQIHHILEDILGEGGTKVKRSSSVSNTRYMRFNPILGFPEDFPLDTTDPKKLALIKQITRDYMGAPEQKQKLADLADLLEGRKGIRKWFRR